MALLKTGFADKYKLLFQTSGMTESMRDNFEPVLIYLNITLYS